MYISLHLSIYIPIYHRTRIYETVLTTWANLMYWIYSTPSYFKNIAHTPLSKFLDQWMG